MRTPVILLLDFPGRKDIEGFVLVGFGRSRKSWSVKTKVKDGITLKWPGVGTFLL
jgi:hypothetical protein